MIFLFPHRDQKTLNWGSIIEKKYNLATFELRYHPFFHFVEVFLISLKSRSRPIYVFRYLGDYPDIPRTLIRVIADVLTIMACFVCGGHVRWVAHNVDKETFTNYSKVLWLRRHIIGLVSKKVYVTDELLLPAAKIYLGVKSEKLGVAPFGIDESPVNENFSTKVAESIRGAKTAMHSVRLVGLCATAAATKCEHIYEMNQLLDKLNKDGIFTLIVLICDFRSVQDVDLERILNELRLREDVICFSKGGRISERFLRDSVDFLYRSLSDMSIPYTLYNAAQARIPVLTHNVGLTGSLIRHTGIGVIWEDLQEHTTHSLSEALSNLSDVKFEDFLISRSWEKGADALVDGVLIRKRQAGGRRPASVIHVCNNYTSSSVHYNIANNMIGFFDYQCFIVPVRTSAELEIKGKSTEKIAVEPVLFKNTIVKFFPLIKSVYVFFLCYRRFFACFSKSKTKHIIAHNFWSDGVLAFLYSLFSSARYTLVVRNTDINIFIPKLLHYRWLMKIMISKAESLVFVSEAHRRLFEERFQGLYGKAGQVEVIPNGVDDFWLRSEVGCFARPQRVCYVGRFNKNKNLVRLISACENLLPQFPELELALVGGDHKILWNLLKREPPAFVKVLGFVEDKEALRDIYRSSRVFAMPSITETFGLVYLEALSQGCAVVCTKSQGIDGLFDFPFVKPVDPYNVDEIKDSIRSLLKFENGVCEPRLKLRLEDFSWSKVGRAYAEVVL